MGRLQLTKRVTRKGSKDIIVASISPGGIVGDGDLVGDATWDALSSSISCFEPFLVTLFVACDRAMVSVFLLSSGLSNFLGTVWEFCQ